MASLSYAKHQEDIVLSRAFKGINDGYYIDIDPQDSMEDSLTRHFYEKGWRGTNILFSDKSYHDFQMHRPWESNILEKINSIQFTNKTYFLKVPAFRLSEFLLDIQAYMPSVIVVSKTTYEAKSDIDSILHWYHSVYFDGHNLFYLSKKEPNLLHNFYPPTNEEKVIVAETIFKDEKINNLEKEVVTANIEIKKLRRDIERLHNAFHAFQPLQNCSQIMRQGIVRRIKRVISKTPRLKMILIRLRDSIIKKTVTTETSSLAQWIEQDRTMVDPKIISDKPCLIFLSPLPPTKSGIADYSAQLLDFLQSYYDVTLVCEDVNQVNKTIKNKYKTISAIAYMQSGNTRNRHMYHFGNSDYHVWMVPLLERFPGTVVLHDVFLGGLNHAMFQKQGTLPLLQKLFEEDGYEALSFYLEHDMHQTLLHYPLHQHFIDKADGIIVHSHYAKSLVKTTDAIQVPFFKEAFEPTMTQEEAKKFLGIDSETFVVCSFGFIGHTKCSKELLDAWKNSKLSQMSTCKLFFVGSLPQSAYGIELKESSATLQNVVITHYCEEDRYQTFLQAADLIVQLRKNSRGESSAAVFDALSYGKPLLVNYNGSFKELPQDAVFFIPDNFTPIELAQALEEMKENQNLCHEIAQQAYKYVSSSHNPLHVSKCYHEAIEYFYAKGMYAPYREALLESNDFHTLFALRADKKPKKLYIDVSDVANNDLRTGIQRVVRSIFHYLREDETLLQHIYPVRLVDGQYIHAQTFMFKWLNYSFVPMDEVPVTMNKNDVFLGLDLYVGGIGANPDIFKQMQAQGVHIWFVLYDILPIQFPHFFPEITAPQFKKWLNVVATYATGVACISKAVANDFEVWLQQTHIQRIEPLHVKTFALGSDIQNTQPTSGITKEQKVFIEDAELTTMALMVGTVEPRKGHTIILEAFELLWNDNNPIKLVIIGKHGWMVDELIHKIKNHPLFNKKLFWFNNASDEFLDIMYSKSTFLIAASEGEGFGLPLIEAAQHGIPIIARDIPSFKEVAGEYATYFENTQNPKIVAANITSWLQEYKLDRHSKKLSLQHTSWKQSASELRALLSSYI